MSIKIEYCIIFKTERNMNVILNDNFNTPAIAVVGNSVCNTSHLGRITISFYKVKIKPTLEMVVGDLEEKILKVTQKCYKMEVNY